MPPLLTFLLCGMVVALSGAALARFGDVIAARTGLGRAFVGALLVAGATSLPELATDIAAIRLGQPDIAVGDLLGSGMANMLILGVIDIWPGVHTLRRAATGHASLATLAIGLTAATGLFVLVPPRVAVLGVGPDTFLIGLLYVVGMTSLRRRGAGAVPPVARDEPSRRPRLGGAVAGFAAASAVILVTAPLFAESASAIAASTGLGAPFVGTVLVGFSTSLPELASSAAAVRAGAHDLAVGNLFGSNAINVALLAVLDVAHSEGPLLGAVASRHAASAFVGIAMMSVGLAAIVRPREAPRKPAAPAGAVMILLYAAGACLLALRGR